MFGFHGHPQVEFNVEANGESNFVSTRTFNINVSSGRIANSVAKSYYDVDNVSGTKASQQALLNNTWITYDANHINFLIPVTTTYATSFNALTGYTFISKVLYITGRGWRYNSIAALTPATRKYRIRFNRSEYVNQLGIMYLGNNNSKTSASNQATATLNIYADQYKNMEALTIYESYITTLNFRPNQKLVNVWISECPVLATINGKLPATITTIMLMALNVTSINTFISLCVNCTSFMTVRITSSNAVLDHLATLTGNLDISFMSVLKEFSIHGATALSTISLPTGKSDWEFFNMTLCVTVAGALSTTRLDEVIGSSTLKAFFFYSNSKSWTRTFVDADFASGLLYWATYNNSFTGDITLATAKASIRDFRTGNQTKRVSTQQNSHPTVDITGLTGAVYIDLTGSDIDDLELPVNTVCTTLFLFDNKLDIVTNPNLLSQVVAMTALTSLYFSNMDNSGALSGQTSANGLGANPDFSALTNLTILCVGACKITGTITLYGTNKLTQLMVAENTGLTSITNFSAHVGIGIIRAYGCTSLVFSIPNTFLTLTTFQAKDTLLSSFDMSGKNTTTLLVQYHIENTPCTSITLPASQSFGKWTNNASFLVIGNSSLTSITNMEYMNFNLVVTGANIFTVRTNSSLDISFPFGQNNFIPNAIQIQDNGMSVSNVDATLWDLINNRTKWNTYTSAKSINVAGSNGTPSGSYAAPTGYRTHAALTITAVTKAAVGVVTVSSIGTVANGDIVYIYGATGMTELNDNYYKVSNISGNTFELETPAGVDVDTTGYGTYTGSAGRARTDGDLSAGTDTKAGTYVLVNQYGWTVTQN